MEGLKDEGEDLPNSCVMEPVLVIVKNIQVRHAYRMVYAGGIIRNLEEVKCLSCAHISILKCLCGSVTSRLTSQRRYNLSRWTFAL